ncbi:MAG: DUF1735 domain-containing protein [Bacteroidales bacterium]|nr:DUF1735 domain-containing protein [Bacteroidales bacterium]
MKNIIKFLFVFIAAGALFTSCDKLTYFEENSHAPDANATYYLQFINASKTFETGVSLTGGLVEVQSSIAVVLMGLPQSQDITVNLVLDPSSTFDASMYTLSANTITIPAGQTSGSVNFSTVAENMPVGETLKFVLNMDAGEHNNPNPAALQLKYNIKRIEFCPLANGAADLVGTWTGTDAWYGSGFTTVLNTPTQLEVTGLAQDFMSDWWGENVVSGGTCTMDVAANGFVTIPRQYIFTTTWAGSPYDYEIAGTGKWTNCGDSPTLLIQYDIYYPGDVNGLAFTYSPAYLDTPYLTADVTLTGKKSAEIKSTILPKKIIRK